MWHKGSTQNLQPNSPTPSWSYQRYKKVSGCSWTSRDTKASYISYHAEDTVNTSGSPLLSVWYNDWAACYMAVFGFLRYSEFTLLQQDNYDSSIHLSLADFAVDSRSSPQIIQVHIKQAKMDPFCQGVNIYFGKTDQDVCPIQWHGQIWANGGATTKYLSWSTHGWR